MTKFIHADSSAIFEEKYWSVFNRWVPILGRDFVACVVSRDWQAREAALSAIESASIGGEREGLNECTGDGAGTVSSALRVFRCLVTVVARYIPVMPDMILNFILLIEKTT